MKASTFLAAYNAFACPLLVYANILFHWTSPKCDPTALGWNGCLRGQVCSSNATCELHPLRSKLHTRAWSEDGRCGPANGGLLCDAESANYSGTCCSRYGWCGSTSEYCDDGCISGCSRAASKARATTARPAIGEPTIGQASEPSTKASSGSAGPATSDGSCGSTHGGSTCGDWYKGSCCSLYGWCGNTTAHCGDGCQSGPCLNGAQAAAPGPKAAPENPTPGSFKIVGDSGVPAMHAGLMPNGRVVFLDKVEDYTRLRLPADGQYAYSAEYDPATNRAVPLAYKTNAFCSGGVFLADGQFVSLGGNFGLDSVDPTVGNGIDGIRYLRRSSTDSKLDGRGWSEPGNKLNSARWYASAQTMPDGTVFVASGSLNGYDPAVAANNNPTYEILDEAGVSKTASIPMDILEKTQPYYMYPFMHLLRDGTLFVLVAKSTELFDVASGQTVKTLPDIPGDYRTYPNTGGSVILPFSSANEWSPDVVVCGGGPYQDLSAPTEASCGRISPLVDDAQWEMDSMPEGRVMVEGTLLPDGTVIWLNGASQGAQGFGLAATPAYKALIYDPAQPLGHRFTSGASSSIARLYHSIALLLLDGTILVAGSNPVEQPVLTPDAENPFVTEFQVEIYTPPYLSGEHANRRPSNISLFEKALVADGSTFHIAFTAPAGAHKASVALYHGGFVTHSLHMGHRMVALDTAGWKRGGTQQMLTVTMPPSRNVAPPGPYVVYVLVDGVPGFGQFVRVS